MSFIQAGFLMGAECALYFHTRGPKLKTIPLAHSFSKREHMFILFSALIFL